MTSLLTFITCLVITAGSPSGTAEMERGQNVELCVNVTVLENVNVLKVFRQGRPIFRYCSPEERKTGCQPSGRFSNQTGKVCLSIFIHDNKTSVKEDYSVELIDKKNIKSNPLFTFTTIPEQLPSTISPEPPSINASTTPASSSEPSSIKYSLETLWVIAVGFALAIAVVIILPIAVVIIKKMRQNNANANANANGRAEDPEEGNPLQNIG